MMKKAGALLVTFVACTAIEPAPLPPFGEALVVVDTDLPVPQIVSRLRVDLLGEDGLVFASRDDVRPDPRDWPTSFSVFTDDTTRGRSVTVRLRGYLEARVAEDGSGEPDPALTVDRAFRVRLEPGRRGRVRITLRGACVGSKAILAPLDDARSCVDAAVPDAPIADVAIEDSLARDVPSEAGSYGRVPCDGVAVPEDRVCVPGGAFVLGDRFWRPARDSLGSGPERVARISRFVIDRDEVSVARYRAAVARGFASPVAVGVTEIDGPPGAGSTATDACTFSAAPRGREEYPLSCAAWVTADALCRFEGGALPTEAAWEYAALAAGRERKAVYPWGDDPPTCDRAVYGRSGFDRSCIVDGAGPQTRRAASGDVTPLGIHDLGGSLEELVVDSEDAFDSRCWKDAPTLDPSCTRPPSAPCAKDPTSLECRLGDDFRRVVRGGGWSTFADSLHGVVRGSTQGGTISSVVGFRCVYPAN